MKTLQEELKAAHKVYEILKPFGIRGYHRITSYIGTWLHDEAAETEKQEKEQQKQK